MAPLLITSLAKLLLMSALVATVRAQSDLENALGSAGVFTLFSDDAAYKEARTAYNLRYEIDPIAVAYPNSTEQVAAVVSAGYSENYQVVARSGGHSYIANGLGGRDRVLVIDLSNLTSIDYNPQSGFATIGTGLRLGNVAEALNDKGRALPHGSCPYVGIGGHAAGGGFGFTSRMWGLTLDTIQELTVVLANGSVTVASETENFDLFWALRGAAPSFGITTSMVVQTFDVPKYAVIYSYSWSMDSRTAARAFVAYQNYFLSDVPAELGAELVFGKGSEQGQVSVTLTGGWYGEHEEALNATLAPLLSEFPNYDSRTVSGDGSYIGSLRELGGGSLDTTAPNGHDTFYAKSLMTPESKIISLKASTAFMNYLAAEGYSSSINWFIQPEVYGGSNSKINTVDVASTAFGSRSSLLTIQFYAYSSDGPFPIEGFTFLDDMVASITESMGDDWDYGAYYNYPDDRLENWQELYYRGNQDRLSSLKGVYDPTGVFRSPLTVTGRNGTSTRKRT